MLLKCKEAAFSKVLQHNANYKYACTSAKLFLYLLDLSQDLAIRCSVRKAVSSYPLPFLSSSSQEATFYILCTKTLGRLYLEKNFAFVSPETTHYTIRNTNLQFSSKIRLQITIILLLPNIHSGSGYLDGFQVRCRSASGKNTTIR